MSSQDNSYSSANEEIVRSLDAIKARAEAATDGPWRVISDYIPGVIEVEGPTASNDYVAELSADKADLEFIAHARQDIPALLAAVEAVLELHEPEATGYGDWVCGACISAGSHDWESTAYPCPTVTAIQSALGEGEQ